MKTNGPGKYDWLASHVRKEVSAQLVVVIVKDGSLGDGFAVQGHPAYVAALPEMLERTARLIREQNDLELDP